MGLNFFRRNVHINGADGFMGVLRAPLGLVNPGALGQIFLAEAGFNKNFGRVARFIGNARGVGTHVGDQGGEAPVSQFHAFVKALGDVHGALGRVGKALVGRLLERGCNERRLRRTLALLFLHALHHKGLVLDGVLHVLRLRGVAYGRLLAAHLGQIRPERGRHVRRQQGFEQPVFLRLENLAGLLALNNEAQGYRLHASGRYAALDGFPEQGRNLVAHQPIQHAPGLLGVKKMRVKLARMRQGVLDRARSNFVELDALDVLGLVTDNFRHVPGNGLPLAIRVRGKVHRVGLGRRSAKIADHVLFVFDHFIMRREVVFLVHTKRAGRQIAHMAHAGLHHVLRSQKFFDGFHLGR